MISVETSRLERASLWWVRLREDEVTPEEIGQWLEWCRSDPANLRSFEQIESLGGRLASLDADRRAQLARELLEPDPIPVTRQRSPRRRWTFRAVAASLTMVLAIGAAAYRQFGPAAVMPDTSGEPTTYVTRRAQIRNLKLPDGSKVAIGAETSLSVHYIAAARRLRLGNGQAYFQVGHNPQRPFIVRAGRLQVTAVGTAFDIRKTGEHVEVIVTRGVVDVKDDANRSSTGSGTPATLPREGVLRVAAGQSVVADVGSPNLIVRPADKQAAISWLNGSMSFVDEKLSLVIANLDRYARRDVVIADPELGDLRFTGTVVQGDEEEWLAAIQKVFPISVRQGGDGRIVLYRRVGSAPPAVRG